jgi:hypothetical protein
MRMDHPRLGEDPENTPSDAVERALEDLESAHEMPLYDRWPPVSEARYRQDMKDAGRGHLLK